MKHPLAIFSVMTITAALSSCYHPTENNSGNVQLTSDKIELSTDDTAKSVDASLDCGCPCLLQNMMVTGDTSVIHFNLGAHATAESVHHIVAMACPSAAQHGVSYKCTFSFVMRESMMMSGRTDYSAKVTATFVRP